MKKKPEQIWGGLGYQRLIIGVIDCIWSTVVGSIINEDFFIEKEGMFNLLDIMEISPKSIQNIILGCLLDFCDNSKTLAHLLQWESNDNSKISHFLCEMWRTEEKDIGVERDSNGIILSTLFLSSETRHHRKMFNLLLLIKIRPNRWLALKALKSTRSCHRTYLASRF
jgi:hypothetical protein